MRAEGDARRVDLCGCRQKDYTKHISKSARTRKSKGKNKSNSERKSKSNSKIIRKQTHATLHACGAINPASFAH